MAPGTPVTADLCQKLPPPKRDVKGLLAGQAEGGQLGCFAAGGAKPGLPQRHEHGGAPLCCLDYALQRSWNSPKNSLLPAWKFFICAYCLIPALELVLIQQPLLPPLPLPFALAINLWCGTLWNALWNSKHTAEFPLSSLAVISSKNSRRLVKYDLL